MWIVLLYFLILIIVESENSIKKIFQCNSLSFSILDIRNPVLRICKWLVLYLISCWYDMKQSKTCTKIIKLWYLSGYWSFHKFIRISSYSLPTPHLIIMGKFVHFKLENLGDRKSLIDWRYLGKLDDKGLESGLVLKCQSFF